MWRYLLYSTRIRLSLPSGTTCCSVGKAEGKTTVPRAARDMGKCPIRAHEYCTHQTTTSASPCPSGATACRRHNMIPCFSRTPPLTRQQRKSIPFTSCSWFCHSGHRQCSLHYRLQMVLPVNRTLDKNSVIGNQGPSYS